LGSVLRATQEAVLRCGSLGQPAASTSQEAVLGVVSPGEQRELAATVYRAWARGIRDSQLVVLRLVLRAVWVGTEMPAELGAALGQLSLRELDLDLWKEATDDQVAAMVGSLRPTLTSLQFSAAYGRITDKSVVRLGELASRCLRLKQLDLNFLDCGGLRSAGVDALYQLVRPLRHLLKFKAEFRKTLVDEVFRSREDLRWYLFGSEALGLGLFDSEDVA